MRGPQRHHPSVPALTPAQLRGLKTPPASSDLPLIDFSLSGVLKARYGRQRTTGLACLSCPPCRLPVDTVDASARYYEVNQWARGSFVWPLSS
jgi:hypothetical protein